MIPSQYKLLFTPWFSY